MQVYPGMKIEIESMLTMTIETLCLNMKRETAIMLK